MRIEEFYGFIREREAIRLRKEAGEPWPWTDDPILQKYRFTNVRRQDDRTSRTLIREFYNRHGNAPAHEILFNAATFRYFGTYEFARAIGWNTATGYSLGKIQIIARERLNKKERVFTGAYIVTNAGRSGPKEKVVCEFLYSLLQKIDDVIAAIQNCWSFQEATEALMRVDGFASFMAKETLLDTRYTAMWPPGTPVDKDHWTAIGPGAARGAGRIKYGVLRRLNASEALEVCRELYTARHDYWPEDYVELELADMQWMCCEWDKHERVRLGEGRPRALYRRTA